MFNFQRKHFLGSSKDDKSRPKLEPCILFEFNGILTKAAHKKVFAVRTRRKINNIHMKF